MSKVFISYSRADGAEEAKRLYELLRVYGIETWRDVDSQRIGEEWTKAIDGAIDDSYAMIVIATEGAMASTAVTYEWARALGLGKDTIKILVIQKCKWDRIHKQLWVYHISQEGEPNLDYSLMDALTQYRNQDGITHVRIPSEADPELRQLAHLAYDIRYGIDSNLEAIRRLADMDDDIARLILINGLNKREDTIRQYILKLMDENRFDDERAIPILLHIALKGRHSNSFIENRRNEDRSGANNILRWMPQKALPYLEVELLTGEDADHVSLVLNTIERLSLGARIIPLISALITKLNANRSIVFLAIDRLKKPLLDPHIRNSGDFPTLVGEFIVPALEKMQSELSYEVLGTDEVEIWANFCVTLEQTGIIGVSDFLLRSKQRGW